MFAQIIFVFFLVIMEFPCVQLNMNKASTATSVLTELLKQNDYVAFLSEPYTAFGKVCSMPKGYEVFHAAAGLGVVRAALVLPRLLSPIFLEHLSTRDCAVAMVRHDERNILLVSMYLDSSIPIAEQEFMDVVMNYCDEHDCGVVLAMDSNAHSDLYSDVESDERGEHLEEFIFRHSLFVANTGNIPTFETARASSIIDVTLVRGVTVRDWEVSQYYNASDHNSIYFMIVVDIQQPKEFRPWHSADWNEFTRSLDGGYVIPETMTIKKLDKLVAYMYSRLNTALDIACPTVLVQPKLSGNRWMTRRLKHLRRRVGFLYKRWIRTRVETDYSAYLASHSRFRKLCRKEKAKSWRKFVTDTKNEHNMAVLTRIAQYKDRKVVNLLRKPDDSISVPGEDTILQMANAHFPNANRIDKPSGPKRVRSTLTSSADIHGKYGEYITCELVKLSLKKFKPFKAAGPDGIKPVVFRHLPHSFIVFLEFIYKCCIHFRYTPYLWQLTKVIWLPKPGKDSYIDPKSFRPISLSNFLLKGLERLITWRMDEHLKYYPIHARQHGFMKGKSTEGALSNTVNYIESQLFRGNICVGVFLDIKSAYDSMDVEQIRSSLLLHGGDDDLVEWYFHYLNNRILEVELHSEVVYFHTSVGFPQGGVASAKFWVIAFNPAIEIINSCFIEGNGYADDCAAVFGCHDVMIIQTRLQRMLDRLVVWGQSCNLSFNATKSVAVLFSRRRSEDVCVLRLGNDTLNFVQSVRYLGVTLDSKLFWTAHLADRVAKAKKFLMMMSAIAKATWGPKPHLMRWVYTCVVRPMILYGSVVWAHEAGRPKFQDQLRHINRLAMCTYTKFPRSTPTRMLEIASDTFPCHLYLIKEALCAFVRLLPLMRLNWTGMNGNINYSTSHRKYWYNLLDEFDIQGYEELDTCYEVNVARTFRVWTEGFGDRGFYTRLPMVSWEVYTDGSKINEQVGSAYRIRRDGLIVFEGSARISDHSTVFQAELYAIHLALSVLENVLELGSVRFFVDSQAALLALCSPIIESKRVKTVVDSLNRLEGVVELVWIKSHSGILDNEAVDRLARDATQLRVVDSQLASRSYIRSQVLDKVRVKWNDEWVRYPKARQSKQFFMGQDKHRAKEIMSLSRYRLGRLIRVTSGHNQLGYHQFVINPLLSRLCRYCDMSDETFAHWADDCPAFAADRQDVFGGPSGVFTSDWSVQLILQFADVPRIKRALSHYVPNDDPDYVDVDSDSNAPDSDLDNDNGDADIDINIDSDTNNVAIEEDPDVPDDVVMSDLDDLDDGRVNTYSDVD